MSIAFRRPTTMAKNVFHLKKTFENPGQSAKYTLFCIFSHEINFENWKGDISSDLNFAIQATYKYTNMPRSHQSLIMFKSCLVKHGLKLFSL